MAPPIPSIMAGAHHQADDGQGQIQGGQALGAQPPGDKKGVGQDIADSPTIPATFRAA